MKIVRNLLSFPLVVVGAILMTLGVYIRHGVVLGARISTAMAEAALEEQDL